MHIERTLGQAIIEASESFRVILLTGAHQVGKTALLQDIKMQNVTESLAGRVAIFNLYGISLAEEEKRAASTPFLPRVDILKQRQKTARVIPLKEMFHKIWRGSYPDVVTHHSTYWANAYLITVISLVM